MALLERVSTLIRANLNELIDKAEHPEIMIKQVILDMENQLLQVKTQVAIAMADQHLLEKKQKENEDKIADGVAKRKWPWARSRMILRAPPLNAASITSRCLKTSASRWPTRHCKWRR